MADISFEARVAVVTGAGRGLGRTYALELARRGASVVVNDVVAAPEVVDEIRAAGGTAVASQDSVMTREGGLAIIQTALDSFGRVDILINNAGFVRDRAFAKLSDEDIDDVIGVHLRAAFNVSQPAFGEMKTQGYGRLVFTASASGLFGNFGQANYGAAKMGLVGLSNVLAIEGAKAGIRSNVIAPIARTRMTEDLLGPLADRFDPELVAPLVVYLASEACELTHQVFSAAGGRFARVFTGLTPGWYGGSSVTTEDIAENLKQILDEQDYIVPLSTRDEVKALLPVLKEQ